MFFKNCACIFFFLFFFFFHSIIFFCEFSVLSASVIWREDVLCSLYLILIMYVLRYICIHLACIHHACTWIAIVWSHIYIHTQVFYESYFYERVNSWPPGIYDDDLITRTVTDITSSLMMCYVLVFAYCLPLIFFSTIFQLYY